MAVDWTKSWSASNDGEILAGSDIQNIQNDIDSDTCQLAGAQTITGDKTFSGTTSFTGVVTELVKVEEFACWENALLSYENEIVYIR